MIRSWVPLLLPALFLLAVAPPTEPAAPQIRFALAPSGGGTPGPGPPVAVGWNLSASVGGFGISMGLAGALTMPSGGIDLGRPDVLSFPLSLPPLVELHVSGLPGAPSVPVPPLGGIGPIRVPGVNVSQFGIEAGVELTASAEITGSCVLGSPPVPCMSPVTWNATGKPTATVVPPPGAQLGDQVPLILQNLSYGISLNLSAVGSAPLIGAFTVPLLPTTPLVGTPSTPARLVANLTVTPLPTITGITSSPAAPEVGTAWSLTVGASGGSGPLRFQFTGLPGGCDPSGTATVRCTPQSAGGFDVEVTATDPEGALSNDHLHVQVVAAAPSPWADLAKTPWTLPAIAAAAGAVVAGTMILRRRPGRGRDGRS